MRFLAKQILLVRLRVERSRIIFDPPLADCRNIVHECFLEIISAAANIPRVSQCSVNQFVIFVTPPSLSVQPSPA